MTKRNDSQKIERPTTVPSQEDEADIIAEVGAEQDESGRFQAPIENIRKVGAMDTETVRRNRHIKDVAEKKRNGEKASFSTDDVLVMYDGLLQAWPASTMHVKLRGLNGGYGGTEMITSFPNSSIELYEEIRARHNQRGGEITYEVEFLDATHKEWRGRAKITIQDTRPKNQQNGNGHYPQQQQPAAPAQPSPQQPFAGPDPMTMFRQMWDMVQSVQPQQQPMPTWPQQSHQPAMPAPPTNPDPASMMKWFQEMFAIVRQVQPASAVHTPQQPQTGPNLPTSPPPPGYAYRWLPESNCCVLEPIHRATPVGREPQPRQFRDRAPYYPNQGEPQERDPYARPQGPPDPIRESMGAVRRAMALREELDSLLGGGQQRGETPEQDSDSPVIIDRTEDGDIIRNRGDGSVRGWETLLVNLPRIVRKGGEYIDKISKTAVAERQRQQREQAAEQLPPGHVRVVEGYEPPPGYVAVPVDRTPPPQQRREPDLPPPPAYVPPPIQEEEEPEPEPRGWDEDL